MLVRFTVENFMSFKERTEFNMLSGDYRRHKHHITNAGGVPLVRAAAIYGANGSGKSNLVKAMQLFVNLFKKEEPELLIGTDFFHELDPACETEPTTLVGEFFLDGAFVEVGVSIKYGVVLKEWMSLLDPKEVQPPKGVYSRTTDINNKVPVELNVDSKFFANPKEDAIRYEVIAKDFKSINTPIIHSIVGYNLKYVDQFTLFIKNFPVLNHSLLSVSRNGLLLGLVFRHPRVFETVNKLICSADLGLAGIEIQSFNLQEYFGLNDTAKRKQVEEAFAKGAKYYNLSDRTITAVAFEDEGSIKVKVLYFLHKGKEAEPVEFITGMESDGTLTSFALVVQFALLKHTNSTLFVDELERSFHPNLLKAYIKSFMDDREVKGQLIFTTHQTNLLDLDLFRQDEIWFVKKNKQGASTMYPLSDYEDVRSDLDIENGYLNGRFGGVPFLGKLEDIANENAPDNTTTP